MNSVKVKISETLSLSVSIVETRDDPPKKLYSFRLFAVNKQNVEYPTRTGFLLPKSAMDDLVNQLMDFMLDQNIPTQDKLEKS